MPVTFAFDDREGRRFTDQWQRAGLVIPLDLHEAPYRDIGMPPRILML